MTDNEERDEVAPLNSRISQLSPKVGWYQNELYEWHSNVRALGGHWENVEQLTQHQIEGDEL